MPSPSSRSDESESADADPGPDDHAEDRVGGDDPHGSDSSSSSRYFRDPILVLFAGVRVFLHAIDSIYGRFERLPGWARFGFGVSAFVASAYFGDEVTLVVDEFTRVVVVSVVRNLLGLSAGMQTIILLLAIVATQTTVISQRTKAIQRELPTEEMEEGEQVAPDGGRAYRTIPTMEPDRMGILGGVAVGIAFGVNFGWGGVFGGAVLGAIVADELLKWNVRRRKRQEITTFVIRTMLRAGIESPDSIPIDRVRSWFPSRDSDLVDQVLDALTSDAEAPLERSPDGRIWLTDMDDAETFLREDLDMITLPR